MKDNPPLITAVIATVVFAFSALVLFITRTPAGDLSVAGVALVGPLVGAVVASYFHTTAISQGAAINTAGAAAGAAAASGQSVQATGSTGNAAVRVGPDVSKA